MRETLLHPIDTIKALLEEVFLPSAKERTHVRAYGELVLEKKNGGVEINGQFIGKENLPDLIRFLAAERQGVKRR